MEWMELRCARFLTDAMLHCDVIHLIDAQWGRDRFVEGAAEKSNAPFCRPRRAQCSGSGG
jgi:hypothetical protein